MFIFKISHKTVKHEDKSRLTLLFVGVGYLHNSSNSSFLLSMSCRDGKAEIQTRNSCTQDRRVLQGVIRAAEITIYNKR